MKRALKTILKEYDNIVFQEAHDIENYQTIEHTIRLLDEIILQNEVIEESNNPYAFKIVVVGKKNRIEEKMN